MIFGPGSDGETTVLGLEQATEILVGSITMKRRVLALLESSWWISHMLRAIAACDDNTISPHSVDIAIERQGQVV
jgi:hypothetical protein